MGQRELLSFFLENPNLKIRVKNLQKAVEGTASIKTYCKRLVSKELVIREWKPGGFEYELNKKNPIILKLLGGDIHEKDKEKFAQYI